VAGIAHDRRDHLQPQWFQAKEHARVHQATGVNGEELHDISLVAQGGICDPAVWVRQGAWLACGAGCDVYRDLGCD
jgi:hypothetical protein